jgi:transcriptional regulator with XRE-family HTH domain
MTETTGARRGQRLRGSDTEWSRLRIARNLSVSELATLSGIARSVVGLIDQGRMVPGPKESAALLRVLSGPETL